MTAHVSDLGCSDESKDEVVTAQPDNMVRWENGGQPELGEEDDDQMKFDTNKEWRNREDNASTLFDLGYCQKSATVSRE